MPKKIIISIRKDLLENVDKVYGEGSRRFFKEPIKCYGVRSAAVKKIAKKYFAQIKNLSKKEIFALCEELLESDFNEEAAIAFVWASGLKKQYAKEDFAVFEKWLEKYVNNWAKCDDFCTHAFGQLLVQFPELLENTGPWTSSKNRWLRRAAAVVMIASIKKKKQLQRVFEVSEKLLTDSDNLVQKGYGWTLKVAGDVFPEEVFAFVLKHKNKMPRTALRYAVEKYPLAKRRLAMNRN